ncbi:MAG: hypothetical protein LBK69_02230, partial [Syntrophomonadaceae bacterium]|nr:hypothetical protein [Syntrophomonadaceae bacterium]
MSQPYHKLFQNTKKTPKKARKYWTPIGIMGIIAVIAAILALQGCGNSSGDAGDVINTTAVKDSDL